MALFQRKYENMSDEELMLAIRSGDEKAFKTLYDRYSLKLARYFYCRLGPDQMVVEDMVQNLFLKIIDKPHLFDSDRRFATWVYSVAMNMCKNEYRRRERRSVEQPRNGAEDFSRQENPEASLDGKLFSEELYRRLRRMDAEKQNTFILRFQHHMSLSEISEAMGCSIGTVKSRLFYTVRALADQLQEYDPNVRK